MKVIKLIQPNKQNNTIHENKTKRNNTTQQQHIKTKHNNDNTKKSSTLKSKTVIQKNNILNYYSCNTITKQTTQLNNTVDNVNSKSDNNITAKQNNISKSKAPDFIIQNRSRILEKARLRRTEKLESSSAISDGQCIARYSEKQISVKEHQNRLTSTGDHPVDKVGATQPRN